MVRLAGPEATNLRSLGASRSARAFLLVILGEYVYFGPRTAWTSTLLAALALIGIEGGAGRRAINRTATSGLITPMRRGRRVEWALTAAGRALMRIGEERVLTYTGPGPEWDGLWLTLVISVPDSLADRRHHLRKRLTWAGFGSPTLGQWVSPHVARGLEARRIVADLDVAQYAYSYVGTFGPVGSEESLVRQAWDLDELRSLYEDFIFRFEGRAMRTGEEYMAAQIELLQAWRKFPFLDPGLPPRFLPKGWPGIRAADVFRRCYQLWGPPSRQHWQQIASADSAGSAGRAMTRS